MASREDLSKLCAKGTVVRHFKGNYYTIIGVGVHTETEETFVIYQSLNNPTIYIRPYDMFISKVDKSKYPNADQEYRFEVAREKGAECN